MTCTPLPPDGEINEEQIKATDSKQPDPVTPPENEAEFGSVLVPSLLLITFELLFSVGISTLDGLTITTVLPRFVGELTPVPRQQGTHDL